MDSFSYDPQLGFLENSMNSFANGKVAPQIQETTSSRHEQDALTADSLSLLRDRLSNLEAVVAERIEATPKKKEVNRSLKIDDLNGETNLPVAKAETDEDAVEKVDAELKGLPELEVKINRLPFENWLKSKKTGERGKSVLDVAIKCHKKGPILNHDRYADPNSASDGTSKSTTSKAIFNDTSEPSSDSKSQSPIRLSINSHHILRELSKVTDYTIKPQSNIIISPFKVLVLHEREISNRLIELERNLGEGVKDTTKDIPHINAGGTQSTSQDGVKIVSGANDHIMQHENVDVASCIEPDAQRRTNERTAVLKEFREGPEEETESAVDKPCEICKETLDTKCTCAQDTVDHLRCLMEFIAVDLQDILEVRSQIRDGSLRFIAFEHLWHLFNPGDIIISAPPQLEAYRVIHVANGRKVLNLMERKDSDDEDQRPVFHKSLPVNPFVIHCFSMNFDGQRFGPVQRFKEIKYYYGKQAVSTLDVFPSKFADNETGFLNDLVKRGKRYQRLTSVLPNKFSHGKYTGPNLWPHEGEINSEVIIDFETALKDNDFLKPPTLGVDQGVISDLGETFEIDPNDDSAVNSIDQDGAFDVKRAEAYTSDMHMLQFYKADTTDMSDDHFMLLPEGIVGWVLRDRMWALLDVNLVEDVTEKNDGDLPGSSKKGSGFEDLVLPKKHKALIESLIRTHSSVTKSALGNATEGRHFDIVEGKGEGLIILLHGVPGVGKTSTAECVAAFTGRPLYPITCGDIGDTAEKVEQNLTGSKGHLRYAQKWGCIMLLDDADVLFGNRQIGNNTENGVVSVFLRTLEYYTGILFLTTNRIGAFDEAFISRIHYSLYYPPLNETSTLQIWNMNIRRIKSRGVITVDDDDEEEIIELAKQHFDGNHRWNGRQIRNAFQTAVALADYDARNQRTKAIAEGFKDAGSILVKPKLTKKAFKKIMAASADFDDYMGHVIHEGSYGESASHAGMRYDEWNDKRVSRAPKIAYSDRVVSDITKRGKAPTGGDVEDKSLNTSALGTYLSDDDSTDAEDLEAMKRELEMLKRRDIAKKSKERRRKEKWKLKAEIERLKSEQAEESEESSNSKRKL